MERTAKEVGAMLRARRKALDRKQHQLAGVSPATVRKIENGTEPNPTTRSKLWLSRNLFLVPDAYDRLRAGADIEEVEMSYADRVQMTRDTMRELAESSARMRESLRSVAQDPRARGEIDEMLVELRRQIVSLTETAADIERFGTPSAGVSQHLRDDALGALQAQLRELTATVRDLQRGQELLLTDDDDVPIPGATDAGQARG